MYYSQKLYENWEFKWGDVQTQLWFVKNFFSTLWFAMNNFSTEHHLQYKANEFCHVSLRIGLGNEQFKTIAFVPEVKFNWLTQTIRLFKKKKKKRV